jgi:SM-20-related protein
MTVGDVGVELLQIPGFLDRATCERIVCELRALPESAAPVYGAGPSSVQAGVRKVSRLEIPRALQEELTRRFEDVRPQIEEWFRVSLSHCEDPQFLHYREGDFFVAHQDGNTPLTLDDSRNRRISVVLFLNEQAEEAGANSYGGGHLVFHGRYPHWKARYTAPSPAGALVAFRSELTHEVTPVTHGHRYTIVTWFR